MEILEIIKTDVNPNNGKRLKSIATYYKVACSKCTRLITVSKQQFNTKNYIPICNICKLSPITCTGKLLLVEDLGMLYRTAESATKTRMAIWKCICGETFTASVNGVATGNTTSCGCEQKRLTSVASSTHNMANSSIYRTWSEMRARCNRKSHKDYDNYGGRGITVCKSWDNSFDKFYADVGARPDGLELDRIDNDKGYYPGNCRWAKRNTQCRNARRKKGITGYRGVDLSGTKFRARITVDYVRINLGSYNTAEEAALAYNNYIISNKLEHLLNELN